MREGQDDVSKQSSVKREMGRVQSAKFQQLSVPLHKEIYQLAGTGLCALSFYRITDASHSLLLEPGRENPLGSSQG